MMNILKPVNRSKIKTSGLIPGGWSFVIFLLFFVSAFGQSNPEIENTPSITDGNKIQISTESPLTEQQVVDLALDYNKKLQTYNTNVQIATHRYNASGWIQNPELRVSNLSTRYVSQDYDELEVGLRCRFPKLGELGEEKQEARVELSQRKVEEIRFRQELIARIRKNYANVLMHDQLAILAQQRVLKEDERIGIIEKLVGLGNRSVVYFTKAKMWHAESRNDFARAIQNQTLARRTLSKRSGINAGQALIMDDLPEVRQELDDLIKLAFKNRPEIELVQQQIALAVRQRNRERFQLIPWPTFFQTSYHREKKRENDWWEFMLGVNLPLFNFNLGNIKATGLAVTKKENQSDAIRESIEEEVRSTYSIYKDLLLDWQNFKISAGELITQADSIVKQARQHATLVPDEVVEMELTIIDTKKLLAEKRQNLAHALIDLYFAMGIEGYEQLN
ncbi:TolC family protein [candidate division KSB1 bacterium]|nr:TolC family protein [candidate division KSB1 bacterium]